MKAFLRQLAEYDAQSKSRPPFRNFGEQEYFFGGVTPMATPQDAIKKLNFKVIETYQWQIDEAKDDAGKEMLCRPPVGRPYELLFFLACRPEMQATRREITDYLWKEDDRPAYHLLSRD